MKQKLLIGMVIIAIVTLAMVTCKDGNDTTHTHQWGEWAVTTPATCVAKGIETRECTLDPTHKETRETAIDPTAHNYQWTETTAPTETAEGEETEICTHDNTHTRGTRPIAKLPSTHTHTWGNWETIPPTCTEDGYDIRICTTDNTHTETENITAALGHDYQLQTTPATAEADGVEIEVCSHDPTHTRNTKLLPFFRTAEISFYDDRYSDTYIATVQGTLTLAQWTGLADRIETAITNAFNDSGNATKNAFRNAFQDDDAVITVEDTTEYNSYKVIESTNPGFVIVKTANMNINSPLTVAEIQDMVRAMVNGTGAIDVYPTP